MQVSDRDRGSAGTLLEETTEQFSSSKSFVGTDKYFSDESKHSSGPAVEFKEQEL